jgi:hypothetical protein
MSGDPTAFVSHRDTELRITGFTTSAPISAVTTTLRGVEIKASLGSIFALNTPLSAKTVRADNSINRSRKQ